MFSPEKLYQEDPDYDNSSPRIEYTPEAEAEAGAIVGHLNLSKKPSDSPIELKKNKVLLEQQAQ